MYNMRRRSLLGAWLGVGAVLSAGRTQAQGWRPTRPVRVIVPGAPGGTTDIVGRLLSMQLTQQWGQSCVVENRSGGGGVIGTLEVIRSPADGGTILSGNIGPQSIAYSIFRNMQYTPDDLIPVSNVVRGPNVLVVNNAVPAQNFQQFMAYLRANQGKVSYGSQGVGQSGHLSAVWFQQVMRTDAVHVPYRGAAPAMIELMAGNVQFMFDNLTTAIQQIRAGKVRALAVTTAERSPQLPDLPTLQEVSPELAQAKFDVSTWFGIFLPKGTSTPVVQALNAEIKTLLDKPEIRQQITEQMAGIPSYGTPEQYKAFVEAEIAKWRTVIQREGLQLDIG